MTETLKAVIAVVRDGNTMARWVGDSVMKRRDAIYIDLPRTNKI